MLLTKTYQVVEQFVKQFTDKATMKQLSGDKREFPFIPINIYGDKEVDFLVRYFNRSGESSIEDYREYYPCIVIQDFPPEIDKQRLWGKNWVEGVYDEVNKKREMVILPIPMNFKFQVSCITRRKKENMGANDWFLQNFISGTQDFFTFNKVDYGDGFVGNVVPYNVDISNITREDGRFEYVYDFSIKTFIHIHQKNYIFVKETGVNNTGVVTGETGNNGTASNPNPSNNQPSTKSGFVGGNFMDTLEDLRVTLSMGNLKDVEAVLQHKFNFE